MNYCYHYSIDIRHYVSQIFIHPILFSGNNKQFPAKEVFIKNQSNPIICTILFVLLMGTFLVACGSSGTTPDPSGSALDGQTIMQQRCSVCHSLDRVTSAQKTADQWTVTVDRMIARGAQLNTKETQTLINYLAANYK